MRVKDETGKAMRSKTRAGYSYDVQPCLRQMICFCPLHMSSQSGVLALKATFGLNQTLKNSCVPNLLVSILWCSIHTVWWTTLDGDIAAQKGTAALHFPGSDDG